MILLITLLEGSSSIVFECVLFPQFMYLLITASVSNKFLAHTLPDIVEASNWLTTFQQGVQWCINDMSSDDPCTFCHLESKHNF